MESYVSKKFIPRPTFRSATGRFFLWADLIVTARKAPGTWFLAFPSAPVATLRAIQQRRHPDLRVPHGRLEARAENEHIADGVRTCDIYVRWMEEQ